MLHKLGDMFTSSHTDVLLVTTNTFTRGDGALVMGRGAAFQLTQKYVNCEYEFGRMVQNHKESRPNEPYGLLISNHWVKPALGIFQVKYHWRNDASLGLIEDSARKLASFACANPILTFALNFPGIGNGRLMERDVLPCLRCLPDNVEVWKYAK